jgi:ABC-type iron transport system FetAB ATPase subunit
VPEGARTRSRTRSPPRAEGIRERLTFLLDVGLNYLTLSRSSGTLSGGESQRIRLASQIGSGLTGVLYVLDEPSIGLHQRDNARLLETLKRLRDLGNTVIVVEHDEDAIRSPTTCSTSAPAPACMAAISSRQARRRTSCAIAIADRQIPHRRIGGGDPGAAAAEPSPHHQGGERARQ